MLFLSTNGSGTEKKCIACWQCMWMTGSPAAPPGYLKGTRSYCLHYDGDKLQLPLSGLSDADWAGDKQDHASISSFVWSLGGGPISWSAKKQNCIALSTTEAEYVALTRAVDEIHGKMAM